jgi:hypothetical protein
VICPSCSSRSLERISVPVVKPSKESGPTRPAALARPGVAGRREPGDALWASWVPESGRLPVDLTGPVPETAYVPHRPGRATLYEEGEPIVFGPPTAGLMPEDASSTAFGGHDAFSNESLASTAIQKLAADPATISGGWGPAGASERGHPVLESAVVDPVLWEALNPTPPHLRESTKHGAVRATHRTHRAREPEPAVECANCPTPIPDPSTATECADCLRPMCSDCTDRTTPPGEAAGCSRCTDLRNLDALTTGVRRRESHPKTHRASPAHHTTAASPRSAAEASTGRSPPKEPA